MSILNSTVNAENSLWLKNSAQKSFYLYFELEAGENTQEVDRIPLNISLVVDRSGSMEGDKLFYVKKAVDFVIDNLTGDDRLSIVQYDTDVDVVSPSAPVLNKKELHDKVARIHARSMTNLSGGMLEGYTQVKSTQQDNYVNRVLLLSDGLANQGVTDPQKLKEMVLNKFRQENIGLSTFGVGADFNELLMTELSEVGGANYYFIDSPDKIPNIFAEELIGLLSVVAQNARLQFQYPSDYFKCAEVYGYPFADKEGIVTINFNDVFAQEKKAVLIRFDLIKAFEHELSFKTSLSYVDVVESMSTMQQEFASKLNPCDEEKAWKEHCNETVLAQVAYFVANKLYEDAIKKGDQRDFNAARELTKQARQYLEAHFKSHAQTEELKSLYSQIESYENNLSKLEQMSHDDYRLSQKLSHMSNYLNKRKKMPHDEQ